MNLEDWCCVGRGSEIIKYYVEYISESFGYDLFSLVIGNVRKLYMFLFIMGLMC